MCNNLISFLFVLREFRDISVIVSWAYGCLCLCVCVCVCVCVFVLVCVCFVCVSHNKILLQRKFIKISMYDMSVCVCQCVLSVCMSVRPSVSLSTHTSIHPSNLPPTHPSVSADMSMSVCLVIPLTPWLIDCLYSSCYFLRNLIVICTLTTPLVSTIHSIH